MVHRSGSSNQCVELVENDESNTKIQSDLQNNDATTTQPTNVATISTNDNELKRPLRASKRLCSISGEFMLPPKPIQPISQPKATASSTTATASSSFAGAFKPKAIRNRRYTVNDCTRPAEKPVPSATYTSATIKVDVKSHDDLYNIHRDRLNCSVSLERLSGFADTFLAAATDINDTGSGSTNKILCLYCDRTFFNTTLHEKHVERVHQSISGRRLSARNTATSLPSTTNYPGCSYCNVGKVTCLESDELMQLVYHLIDRHSDKYFACKPCLLRFQTHDLLVKHAVVMHGMKVARPKKDAAARKTARNVQLLTTITSAVSHSSASSVSSATSSTWSSHPASAVTPLSVQVDFDLMDAETDPLSIEPNLRNRLRSSTDLKTAGRGEQSTRKQLMSSEETFLSRLGIGLNRSPRSRKGAKNRRGCSSEAFDNMRSTRSGRNSKQSLASSDAGDSAKATSSKLDTIATAYDEDFYESVNQNVKQNLSCHLDGKLESGPMSPSPLSPVANIPTVRSILVKSPLAPETEIHEATTISAFTAFPTLLTAQQYGGEPLSNGKMKKPITKNSWKWKWDCVKKYKFVNEGGKIVKKVKQSTCGTRDLSTLDMWTQLTMRTRNETTEREENESTGADNVLSISEAAREEKRKLIDCLNKILDTRMQPSISIERSDQTIIKIERNEEYVRSDSFSGSNAMANDSAGPSGDVNFPAMMQLIKRDRSAERSQTSLILSGEWARPRCYICFGCGSLFSTLRLLEDHKISKHPFVLSTHYEIVGKELIDGDLFRNFYIPSLALQRNSVLNRKPFYPAICSAEDSMDSMTSYSLTKSDSFDLDTNSRNSKVSVSSMASVSDGLPYSTSADDESSSDRTLTQTTVCSKCERQCKGTMDLYRHMLDCSSDYAWLVAKKRNNVKYRYFGCRRRRPQRSGSTNARRIARPKKERHNSDTSSSQKSKEPTTPRQRPSDGVYSNMSIEHFFLFSFVCTISLNFFVILAESIERMLANLPAKRAARQIFPNLAPKSPNKKILPNALNRKKILLKQKGSGRTFKVVSTSSTTINAVGTNLALRKRRTVENAVAAAVRTRSSPRPLRVAGGKSSVKMTKMSLNSKSSPSLPINAIKPTSDHRTKAKLNELGNALRRQTKAVVTKITKKLRCVPTKRLLRTSSAHHTPHTSKNTSSAKLDKTKQNTSKSKKSFLRNLSFRRSTCKNKTTTSTTITTGNMNKNAENSSAEAATSDDKSSNKSSETKRKSPRLCETESTTLVDAPELAQTSMGSSENQPDPMKTAAESNVPEAPRLKRKRSIKTIINEMRAKCQSQADATHASDTLAIPVIEVAPVTLIVEENESKASDSQVPLILNDTEARTTPVTEPLSLTIEPFDKPLDLCTSPQKHLAQLSTKSCASSTASTEQENISPRRRTRKLNDCIAMLTGKLQEKLGVPFIDESSGLLPILSPGSEQTQNKQPAEAPPADVAPDAGAESKTSELLEEPSGSVVTKSSPTSEPTASETHTAALEQPATESSEVPLPVSEVSPTTEPVQAAGINDSGIDMDIAPRPTLKDEQQDEPAMKSPIATETLVNKPNSILSTPEKTSTSEQDSVVPLVVVAETPLEQLEQEISAEIISTKDTKTALQQEENDKSSWRDTDSRTIEQEKVSTSESICSKGAEIPVEQESELKPESEPQREVAKRVTKEKQPENRAAKKTKVKPADDVKKDVAASELAQNITKNDENVNKANDAQGSDNSGNVTDSRLVKTTNGSPSQVDENELNETHAVRKTRSSKQTLKEVNTLELDAKTKESTVDPLPSMADSSKSPESKIESNVPSVDKEVKEPSVNPPAIEVSTDSPQESPSTESTKKPKLSRSKKEIVADQKSQEVPVKLPIEVAVGKESPQKSTPADLPRNVKSTRSKRVADAAPAEQQMQIAPAFVDGSSEAILTDKLPPTELTPKGKSSKSRKGSSADQITTGAPTDDAANDNLKASVESLPQVESSRKARSSKTKKETLAIQTTDGVSSDTASEITTDAPLQRVLSVESLPNAKSTRAKKDTPKVQKVETVSTDTSSGDTNEDPSQKLPPVELTKETKSTKSRKESSRVQTVEMVSDNPAPDAAKEDPLPNLPPVESPQKSKSSKTKKETSKTQTVQEVSANAALDITTEVSLQSSLCVEPPQKEKPSRAKKETLKVEKVEEIPANTPPKCTSTDSSQKSMPAELPHKVKLSKIQKGTAVVEEVREVCTDAASKAVSDDSLQESPRRANSRSRKQIAAAQKAEEVSKNAAMGISTENLLQESAQKARSSIAKIEIPTARKSKEPPVKIPSEITPEKPALELTPTVHKKSKKGTVLPANDELEEGKSHHSSSVLEVVPSKAQMSKSSKSKKQTKQKSTAPEEFDAAEQLEPKVVALEKASESAEPKTSPVNEPKAERCKSAAKSKSKLTTRPELPEAVDESLSKSKSKDKKSSNKVDQKTTKATGKAAKKGAKDVEKQEAAATGHDDSDEELLPWDPEKGFVTSESETVSKVERESIPSPIDEPSSSAAKPLHESVVDEQLTEAELPVAVPKVKKKRKCELAYLIADQLLESFKEVDQSRIDDLKKVHDLSLTNSGDLTSTSISTTPKPQRRSKKLFQEPEVKSDPRPSKKAKTDFAKPTASKDVKKESPVSTKDVKEKESVQPTGGSKADVDHPPETLNDPIESVKTTSAERKSSKKESKCKSKRHLAKLAKQKHQAIKVSDGQSSTTDKTAASKVQYTPSKIVDPFSKATLIDDINKDSFSATAANTQKSVPQSKMVAKSLFRDTSPVKQAIVPPSTCQSLMGSIASYNLLAEKNTAKQVTESLFSQKNPAPERLSDIIGLADKATLPSVPSLKTAVFPQWNSGIEKQSVSLDKDKVSLLSDNKLNFWNRSTTMQSADSDKSKLFGVIKDKAKHLFSKLSKKKIKKSIKSSIRDSSCSSSSSSSSSNSSSSAPKKPLLRPSILSCKNFRDTVVVKNPSESANPSASSDIFDSLRNSAAVPLKKATSSILSPQKLNVPRSELKPSILSSPVASDTNIPFDKLKKEESTSSVVTPNLNTAFINHKRLPPAMKQTRRQTAANADKPILPTAPPKSCTDFDDDSQDTIISQIVSKIREKADRTDSDDEMCLEGVTQAASAGKEAVASSSAIEPSDVAVQQDLSALVSDIKQKLEREQDTDVEHSVGKVADSTIGDAEYSDNDDDMDHDDSESVNTSFSQSTSITSGGGKKKRKKKSILSKRKAKRGSDRDFTTPDKVFYCDICDKSYRNQHGLSNHKATIMHISKLSQLEFLDAKKKGDKVKTEHGDNKVEEAIVERPGKVIGDKPKLESVEPKLPPVPVVNIIEANQDVAITVAAATKNIACTTDPSPYVSPKHSIDAALSPEQASRPNGTPKHTPTALNARLNLSQEERLFYECCSMLKGSDRSLGVAELVTKPVTPKSSEENSNIAHSAQSPRSHPSPRPGIPRIELNQFSDASSDSNPAYSCPQVPSSSKTQKVFAYDAQVKPLKEPPKDIREFTTRHHSTSAALATDDSMKSSYPNSSRIVRNYPDSYSDMGDSFPSSQDAQDESEHYTRTILDRSSQTANEVQQKALGLPHAPPKRGRIDYGTPVIRDHFDSSGLSTR